MLDSASSLHTWGSGHCNQNKENCDLNQPLFRSFVEEVAKKAMRTGMRTTMTITLKMAGQERSDFCVVFTMILCMITVKTTYISDRSCFAIVSVNVYTSDYDQLDEEKIAAVPGHRLWF